PADCSIPGRSRGAREHGHNQGRRSSFGAWEGAYAMGRDGQQLGEGGEPLDDETRSYLEELVSTPLGRRWVLKAGLASAVALGVGSRMGTGTAEAAPKKHRRRMERTDLHFAFGNARGVTGMVLIAN